MLDFFQMKVAEKVASIGCGGGLWEIIRSFSCEKVAFTLQDINAQLLNEQEVKNTIIYFEKQYKQLSDCSFQIVIGTPKNSNLQSHFFDKVLLINSFHEFDHQILMLNECFRILKPNGLLLIEEQIASYAGEVHIGCNKTLFTENELLQFVSQIGFKCNNKHYYENKMAFEFTKYLPKHT